MRHAAQHVVFRKIHIHLTVAADGEFFYFIGHVDGLGPDVVHDVL